MQLPDFFKTTKPVIGMLHVPALPGSPQNKLALHAIVDSVIEDVEAMAGSGIDGLMIENFGDVPFYPQHVPPHSQAVRPSILSGRPIEICDQIEHFRIPKTRPLHAFAFHEIQHLGTVGPEHGRHSHGIERAVNRRQSRRPGVNAAP